MTFQSSYTNTSAFELTKIQKYDATQKVSGYFLESTATINVEADHLTPDPELNKANIQEIASYLMTCNEPQIVMMIHGYANRKSDAKDRYEKINKYVQTLNLSNSIFVGYRWPSENPIKDDQVASTPPTSWQNKIAYAFQALPTLVLGLFISSLVLGIITISLLLGKNLVPPIISFLAIAIVTSFLGFFFSQISKDEDTKTNNFLPIFPNGVILVLSAFLIGAIANFTSALIVLAIIFALLLGIVLTLILLRLVTYSRDRYRAHNYAVLDLVEFIRQLDQAIIEEACQQTNCPKDKDIEIEATNKSRVRLSFIAHSLGCEVVTQAVRILSDVFDPDSIGETEIEKKPDPNIGRVFKLERLVLVAPDIPIDSVLSGRTNFLKPSIRRFQEKYVFCNEADLALRLASTAANYFSFPSKSRFRGYKLGNITVSHFKDSKDRNKRKLAEQDYGIVNHKNAPRELPRDYLEIRASNLEHRKLEELPKSKQDQILFKIGKIVADEFTYFDCTDYCDHRGELNTSDPINQEPKGVVSNALKKSALNLWPDYNNLFIANFITKKIDGHGGYFNGKFSQKLIYQMAFLGFKGLLVSYTTVELSEKANEQYDQFIKAAKDDLLDNFSLECQSKQIQVVLSQKSTAQLNL